LGPQHFQEFNQQVERNEKPVFCFGEPLFDREGGQVASSVVEHAHEHWQYLQRCIMQVPDGEQVKNEWSKTLDEKGRQ